MKKIKQDEIDNRFTYHPPRPEQIDTYTTIRAMGRDFATVLNNRCPDSRELSVALTKLDEVVMWANASIARDA